MSPLLANVPATAAPHLPVGAMPDDPDSPDGSDTPLEALLEALNAEQRRAVLQGLPAHARPVPAAGDAHDDRAVLVLAGAGTGKTATLSARVAALLHRGLAPERILLLTFSRRAASEMIRRAGMLLNGAAGHAGPAARLVLPWAGTFHSVASRLLRQHADAFGLDPDFTILDRADAIDLLDWLREQQGLGAQRRRFARAGTCLAIYSDRLNSGDDLDTVLARRFPWCVPSRQELSGLFQAYVREKQRQSLLDYDDLLQWMALGLADDTLAAQLRGRFDAVLVDEFQDSNALQHAMLRGLAPGGRGVFAVGDDAQAIYGFRGASLQAMRGYPAQCEPAARTLALTTNYRSTQSILDTANRLMAEATDATARVLRAHDGRQGARPVLACVDDDSAQSDYVIAQVLQQREAGIALKDQAVLFRTASHSDALELALARSGIPFVKHGGLRFAEAAHVKDVLALLRWSVNPRNLLAASRVLQMLPGIGPAHARGLLAHWQRMAGSGDPSLASLRDCTVPEAAREYWPELVRLLVAFASARADWHQVFDPLLAWLGPLLRARHDNATSRLADLDMLHQVALASPNLQALLADFALDPPQAGGVPGDKAHLDEDYLVLSTVHSAKGQEWHSVYLLNVADGNFPNEYATHSTEAIAEERRLLYVALTRARQTLHLIEPRCYFVTHQRRLGAAHVTGARSRFLSATVLQTLHRTSGTAGNGVARASHPPAEPARPSGAPAASAGAQGPLDSPIARRLQALWADPPDC